MKNLIPFFLLAAVSLLSYPAAAQSTTYWINESTDFTGNGCENTDLNDVTSSLRFRLENDGWSGIRWTNRNAWPEDFIEQNLGGIDHVAGDSRTLAIYAGHGNRGMIQFGFRRGGRCTVSFPTQSRLGAQGGANAVYAMWLTSCTINTGSLNTHFNQEVRQAFGYHNSPPIKDDQPREFYKETDDLRNERAWIEEMEDRPGWFTGDNSPIALTFGRSAADCERVRSGAFLRAGRLLSPPTGPKTHWCYYMYNNGQSGC